MWVSVALETDAAHAEALSDALMAAGAISVSVEDALAGTDLETPQFGEPDGSGGMPASPLWNQSRVVALFDPRADLLGRIASAQPRPASTTCPTSNSRTSRSRTGCA
jgi:ribosomal protein L11 methyltransferase